MNAALETKKGSLYGQLAGFIVEQNYIDLGVWKWDTREVQRLLAKFGDTREVMAARLRITRSQFEKKMQLDSFTPQDELILTMLEREIDFVRGGIVPDRPLFATAITTLVVPPQPKPEPTPP